ncbi:hypothetical protein UK12_33520, partial [Saccharothrix sp. ST-888]
ARHARGGLLAGHRLTAVVPTAGVVDDAVSSSLPRERLDAGLGRKVAAGWELHGLTRDHARAPSDAHPPSAETTPRIGARELTARGEASRSARGSGWPAGR